MGGKRVFELVLEIGHKSTPLNKKLANGYTHKWTAFVRSPTNSKIDHCIQRVVFQLHESFPNPYREISEQPFQIKETGYAGFEIPIQIYFKNRDKPNHLVFIHDLCLLTNKPNNASTIEKIKFINPNKEFEKCLIKSGAQLLASAVKKERSDSPPAKKQKSSSLIPSKDMSKQSQLQAQPQPQVQPQAQSQPQPQSQHLHSSGIGGAGGGGGGGSGGGGSGGGSSSNSSGGSSRQQPHKKSSKDFIDVFGAPLVYNKPDKWSQSGGSTTTTSNQNSRTTKTVEKPVVVKEEPNFNELLSSQSASTAKPTPRTTKTSEKPATVKEEPYVNELLLMQTKISSLTDCDRLQKIVDIVEEAGEWFNLTPKKFEFDLKRLDKKTLSRIERCLPH